jgi:4-alpha-glucanotransferase
MKFPRASGILLHPTSLSGRFGIGELGREAREFADFLHDAGMKIWQVLPLNPTGYGDSPYQSFSAFAGNPLLISLEALAEEGLLDREDIGDPPEFAADHVDFAGVIDYKAKLLRRAADNFLGQGDRTEFDHFCSGQAAWLDDFALFMAAKDAHDGTVWTDWDRPLAMREPEALRRWRDKLSLDIDAHKFWQYVFFRQWRSVKSYCNERQIRLMGDIPIYVAHDSADVWSHPDLFFLDQQGRPEIVAGVPPDYFSATGQLWGNPIYRWDVMRTRGYEWWIDRFRACLAMFDMVRVDHFRGFEAYWEIPTGEPTATNGRWVKGPGAGLFEKVTAVLGDLPIVAENLGVITPEVEEIRRRFGYPGMAILQFAFSTDPQAPTFRPHNYVHHQVAYTGGHDNDTMCGWWRSGVSDSTRSESDVQKESQDAVDYFGLSREDFDREVNWIFVREVMRSVADTVLFPVQDVLGVGSEARMNVPGTLGGRNWKWRMLPGALRDEHRQRLRLFADIYDR